MNTREGDSQRGRPRRLIEYRMAPRAAGRRLGAALTQLTTGRPIPWLNQDHAFNQPPLPGGHHCGASLHWILSIWWEPQLATVN